MNSKLILVCILFTHNAVMYSQQYSIDSLKNEYSFINWKANKIKLAENSPAFKKIYQKLHKVVQGEQEKIHIFHIGGSHIQADIYSNRLRSYLQHMSTTAKGQRGFIFPYRMAETNNPSNYEVDFDGEWQGYRCSIRKDSIAWGMSGVTAKFKDSLANIKINANYLNYTKNTYQFDKIRVFYNTWSDGYEVLIKDTSLVKNFVINQQANFIEYQLNKSVETIEVQVCKIKDTVDAEFLMMGLELMNDSKGIEYTTIGVNGASFSYYNRSAYFTQQLSLYKPDLFIVSVGTNDAYHPDFSPKEFRRNYENFIQDILNINPDCAILLTVPNDSYYKKQYPNPRTRISRAIIYDLAKKYKMAVWDFYEIMGGFNSSKDWYANKLMPNDRIHFTHKGYNLKADLLLQALSNSWEKELQLEHNSILKQIVNE
ncbi:GDSL-type esterase/lipase family protein [Aquimarina sp. W85]|uniref:GDSL-type esterase/lipase family protein n=1 Tax=Aquimarina rhodophyticola TaxID=3342246 RepID=UPI00366C4753